MAANASCPQVDFLNTIRNPEKLFAAAFLPILNLTIIVGNVLVICAVIKSSKLHRVNGILITSLAIADCSLGTIVLPFSVAKELLDSWLFGSIWCKVWLQLDVFFSTASIYNLVMIAIDRCIAVAKPLQYRVYFTPRKGWYMALLTWTVSALVSAPELVWKYVFNNDALTLEKFIRAADSAGLACKEICSPANNEPSYILYSACASFYLPMLLIIPVYVKIYFIAQQVNRRTANGYQSNFRLDESTALRAYRGGQMNTSSNNTPKTNLTTRKSSATTNGYSPINSPLDTPCTGREASQMHRPVISCNSHTIKSRQSALYFELRAAKTVALVTGCFFISWVGFAICYVLEAMPSCRAQSCMSPRLFNIVFWMGYANSAVNPIIYGLSSHEFRKAFFELIMCKKHNQRSPSIRNKDQRQMYASVKCRV